ncbi:hypothetical protein G6F32_016498 [Rhizopus arrhizus]|nr:hypothetical protein G6F32_016498 [Rhizopus arrhizus]
MEGGLCAERGRRLHPVRHEHGHRRRDRGRAPPAVRGHDPGQRALAADRAATLLCAPADGHGRPPRVWFPHALHHQCHAAAV